MFLCQIPETRVEATDHAQRTLDDAASLVFREQCVRRLPNDGCE